MNRETKFSLTSTEQQGHSSGASYKPGFHPKLTPGGWSQTRGTGALPAPQTALGWTCRVCEQQEGSRGQNLPARIILKGERGKALDFQGVTLKDLSVNSSKTPARGMGPSLP